MGGKEERCLLLPFVALSIRETSKHNCFCPDLPEKSLFQKLSSLSPKQCPCSSSHLSSFSHKSFVKCLGAVPGEKLGTDPTDIKAVSYQKGTRDLNKAEFHMEAKGLNFLCFSVHFYLNIRSKKMLIYTPKCLTEIFVKIAFFQCNFFFTFI